MFTYSDEFEQNKWKRDIATYQRMQEWISKPVFTQGEVQQLRKLLSAEIYALEQDAWVAKEDAHSYKKTFKSLSEDCWKEHFKLRAKIKKLAKLQVKMKAFDELY